MARGSGECSASWTIAAVLSAAAVLLSACGVVFDAPEVTLLVRDEGIVYVGGSGDAERVVGGETVVRVSNDSSEPREVVLARLGEQRTIPQQLLEAESPRDDDRILGISPVLEPKESSFESGGFGYEYDTASFHVYLAPGERYVVFDRLGGSPSEVRLDIVPGESTA